MSSTDPLGGPSSWTTTQLEAPMELRGISCASASLCVAVGDNGSNIRPRPGDQGRILASTDPLGGSWQTAQAPIQGNAYGVACPTASLCVSGDLLGNLVVSTAPALPGSWRAVASGSSVQITDVDCPSAANCAAVDTNGDVITSTEPSGGAWTRTNLAPFPGVEETAANGMFGISCPGVTLCAIAANDGQIFTSTDPFAASPPPPAPTSPGKTLKHRKRPKRPRVNIASGPPPGVETAGRSVPVQFHFFARHRYQVRGFLCRLDGRHFRRCRSPKRYGVGFGRHVFRVRAIGWTGLRGPVAKWRFRVCHPTGYSECIKHPPPPLPPVATARRSRRGIGYRFLF